MSKGIEPRSGGSPKSPWVVWRRVAEDLDADFVTGRPTSGPAVQWKTEYGIVTLHRRVVREEYLYQVRAPFLNPRPVRFAIYPTSRSRLFGIKRRYRDARDVETGDSELDHLFHVETQSPVEVQGLLAVPKVRELLRSLPQVTLGVRHFVSGTQFPDGVDEVFTATRRPPLDNDLLRRTFELFSEILRYFGEAGTDDEDQVRLNIKRLEAPGGVVRSEWLVAETGLLLWDGETPRWQAAEALGRYGDSRAVRPLTKALGDPHRLVRLKAVRALGRLGDTGSIHALIPLLGLQDEDVDGDIGDVAAEALAALGAGPLVSAF